MEKLGGTKGEKRNVIIFSKLQLNNKHDVYIAGEEYLESRHLLCDI